jgi:predicted hotdog family 3-hydroxylacyl-ACP dehydratase
MRLDHAWIERHIPHQGRMCLLDEVIEWDAHHIRCRSGTHRLADHPMRSHGRLGVACGIEYAAQAMAVHAALIGGAAAGGLPSVGLSSASLPGASLPGAGQAATRPAAGFLASLREVRMHVSRLDDIAGDLICAATQVAGDGVTALYEFSLWSGVRQLLSGRTTVVLDADNRLNL